jgi:hypothetical protein
MRTSENAGSMFVFVRVLSIEMRPDDRAGVNGASAHRVLHSKELFNADSSAFLLDTSVMNVNASREPLMEGAEPGIPIDRSAPALIAGGSQVKLI